MKRLFMTFAAMLLVSVSAFAQSNEPLKGDVNGDNRVDVADVVEIINLANGAYTNGPKYYWYIGAEKPSGISVDELIKQYNDNGRQPINIESALFSNLDVLQSIPNTYATTPGGTEEQDYVIAVTPSDWYNKDHKLLLPVGGAQLAVVIEVECVVDDIRYTIWSSASELSKNMPFNYLKY